MKKILLVLACLFMLLGMGISSAPAFAAGSVNDFEIQDYQIDYYMGRDKTGRSTLKTVESISATFPATDQNHGIERAIPSSYDGHSTSLSVISVTNNGVAQDFATRTVNGNTVLRIGNASTYVHGLQNYKITYSQRDITKFFEGTNADEFYWDTNGTEWAVPVKSLTVRLHIADDVAAALNDKQQCYVGRAGSTDPCSLTATDDGFVARADSLQPYENMTIAVGFQPHTFAPYRATPLERLFGIWISLLAVTFGIALLLIIWLLVRYHRRSNRTAEIRTIIPEYLPPPNTSVAVSGSIINQAHNIFSAQLIDLAVRHYIRIYQTREKKWFKQANYELEIIKDIASLKSEEQEILRDIFGDPHVNARLNMETLKRNSTVGVKLNDNQKKLVKSITGRYALRARDNKQSTWFARQGIITLLLAVLTLSPFLLVAAIVAFVCGFILKPLTDKGLELSRYLKGLELYIKTAEAERLRMLQSPEGAAKQHAPIDINDKRQLIKLYERVLPYAILFGQEKEWNNRLGQYYASINQSPTWLASNNAIFSAAVFSSAISGLNTVASYSDPSSSASGGSSGGGSSGGGGGGGGGGGW